ncbi:MAG TPA: iron-sulfur cluster assembly scaffold protein [Planctomycetota bacterium]|nr:iron-sulfur cluster assembly scaffold protein [Planctomycetota bacterium]
MQPDLTSAREPGPPPAAADDPFFGRLNDPSSAASIRGLCGDEIEIYLVIDDSVITDVKYYTEGCEHTRLCGQAVARRAKGKTLLDALAISPREIIDSETTLPEDGRHCAILAMSTLYRAIADYLLTP